MEDVDAVAGRVRSSEGTLLKSRDSVLFNVGSESGCCCCFCCGTFGCVGAKGWP